MTDLGRKLERPQGTARKSMRCAIVPRCNSILAMALVAMAITARCEDPSSVRVTVLDDHGNPVPRATARADLLEPSRAMMMVVPECLSNEEGKCVLRLWMYGKWFISASKPDDGYPPQNAFFLESDAHLNTTELTREHPSEDVVVHLGKKAGILRGTVKDAVTGKLLNASFLVHRVAEPNNFQSGTGITTERPWMLIPSDVPITLTVLLDGYDDWVYSTGRGATPNTILLGPGQETTLDIRLKPKSVETHDPPGC